MSRQENKDKGIAALLTLLIAAAVVVALLCLGLTWNPALLAVNNSPEISTDEEEELFIEPELLQDNLDELGEEESEQQDEPAPVQLGEPQQAEAENTKVVVKGENPKPAPQKEKLVTQQKESPVKAQDPPKTDKEEQKATSKMASQFGQNGNKGGKNESAGAGGSGGGYTGNLKGRKLMSCPMPQVTLRNKTVVTVTVKVDESGKVIGTPTASGGSDESIRQRCIAAAKQAKWEEKKGAGTVTGTITFTIIPK